MNNDINGGNSSKNSNKSDRKIIHLYWIIFFLIIIICCLVAIIFCRLNDNTILDFISAFSTLLSIVLSLIAIFYTFLSGIESQRINHETETAIHGIKNELGSLSGKIQGYIALENSINKAIESAIQITEKHENSITEEDGTSLDEQRKEFAASLKGLKMQMNDIASKYNSDRR